MAIQTRSGNYSDFDPSKLLPGEWACVRKEDPNAEDGRAVYMAFEPGVVKRMATHEDIVDQVKESFGDAAEELAAEFTEEMRTATDNATVAAKDAEQAAENANKAVEDANTATSNANDAADKANEAAEKAESAGVDIDYSEIAFDTEEIVVDSSGSVVESTECVVSGTLGSVNIITNWDFPSGFTSLNSIILGIMVYVSDDYVGDGTLHGWVNVTYGAESIQIVTKDDGVVGVPFKLVLKKIEGLS